MSANVSTEHGRYVALVWAGGKEYVYKSDSIKDVQTYIVGIVGLHFDGMNEDSLNIRATVLDSVGHGTILIISSYMMGLQLELASAAVNQSLLNPLEVIPGDRCIDRSVTVYNVWCMD